MTKTCLLLTSFYVAACSNHQLSNTSAVKGAVNSSPHEATVWIENNLKPLHSLVGHVAPKSIAKLMLEDKIAGVSVAFIEKGAVAWTKAYGYSNLETLEKVTEKTIFTGASLSKPLTAMAALNLVESEKLNLDENVNRILIGWKVPETPLTNIEKVTLRRLIGHRAGIKNDLWSSYLPDQMVPTVEQMLAGQAPSVDPATSVISIPGSTEKYSNPGYSIIQNMLEDATSLSFDNILDELVLKPSGMNDSSFAQPIPEELQQRRAIGYDKALQPYPYRLFPFKAAGGVWTTPIDIGKFIITLFKDLNGQHNIVSSAMMEQVFARDGERLGFSKIFDQHSEDLIFRHYGSNQGFTAYMVGSVQHQQAVVIMINSDNGFALLDYIARAVAEYYQWDYLQPSQYLAYLSKIPHLKDYTGRFNNNNEILTFKLEGEKLWVTSETHLTPVELTAVSDSTFICATDSVKYEFYRPRGVSEGEFKWVRVIVPSGNDNYAEKVL